MTIQTRGMQILLIVLIIIVSSSCNFPELKNIAAEEVVKLHELYNKSNYKEIYVHATAEFQDSSSEEKFNKFLTVVKNKIGSVITSKEIQWNVQAINGYSYVTISYNVTYEKGKAVEMFKYKLFGTTPKLLVYNINSNDLIMN